MKFKKSEIKKALDFYEINNTDYENKCYKCLSYLEENKLFLKNALNLYKIIYCSNNNKIRFLWKHKNIEDIFRCNIDKYITNILLLSGYKKHIKSIKRFKFDINQQKLQKRRIKECLLSSKDIEEGISVSQMLWGAYFFNGNILEVGRLQFEFLRFDPTNPILNKKCIKIHIPKGTKLYKELVLDSINEAKNLIKKYYKLKNIQMYCDSWLLSKEIKNAFPDSNIASFASLFNILKESDATKDILHYVFKKEECVDYQELSEKTSLEKYLKTMLINGKVIHKAIGKLKDIN